MYTWHSKFISYVSVMPINKHRRLWLTVVTIYMAQNEKASWKQYIIDWFDSKIQTRTTIKSGNQSIDNWFNRFV